MSQKSSSLSPNVSAQPLRVAVLSCAHLHAASYASSLKASPRADLVGVWNEDQAAGAEFASQYEADYYSSLDHLLNQSLDAVVIASENIFHRPIAEKAVNAGVKAILCEKPLATNIEDARAMLDICKANDVKLATAFPCRFSPAFERLQKHVSSGQLGKILAIRATNHGGCPFGWFVDVAKSGGGAIIDHSVHVADLNRLLLGSEAVEVYAERGNNMYHQSWEDCGFLTITYANGTFTTLDTSWSRPRTSFPTWGDVTMEALGERGIANLDMFRQSSTLYSEDSHNVRHLGWGSGTDDGMINAFLDVALGIGSDRLATGLDGLRALAVASAAYESVRLGKSVPVDNR